MKGRNGKTLITKEIIDKVKYIIKTGGSTYDAARSAGIAQSTAHKIASGSNKKKAFFKHDNYYL